MGGFITICKVCSRDYKFYRKTWQTFSCMSVMAKSLKSCLPPLYMEQLLVLGVCLLCQSF